MTANHYRTVTPYLKLPECGRLLAFLKQAFDAVEHFQLLKPDGSVLHAEVLIGDTLIMVHDLPPDSWTPKPSTLYLRVDDADATYKRSLEAGAVSVFKPANMYYGARVACVTDVSGNEWWIASLLEKLSLDEIQRRATAFLAARNAQNSSEEPTATAK